MMKSQIACDCKLCCKGLYMVAQKSIPSFLKQSLWISMRNVTDVFNRPVCTWAYNKLSSFLSYQHYTDAILWFWRARKRPSIHTANYAVQAKVTKRHNIAVTESRSAKFVRFPPGISTFPQNFVKFGWLAIKNDTLQLLKAMLKQTKNERVIDWKLFVVFDPRQLPPVSSFHFIPHITAAVDKWKIYMNMTIALPVKVKVKGTTLV